MVDQIRRNFKGNIDFMEKFGYKWVFLIYKIGKKL